MLKAIASLFFNIFQSIAFLMIINSGQYALAAAYFMFCILHAIDLKNK